MTWFKNLLWWQTEGTEIVCYDNKGTRFPVKFRGTNIIGFETGFFCFGDMWEKDPNNHSTGGGMTFDDIFDKMQYLGFNALRIPITAVFLMEKLNQRVENLGTQNKDIKNKTYGELLHIVLAKCCERNIMVLLDFHKCETGEIEEMFSDKYPESKVMECHRILCNQYANNYNCVFGIELKNEPHIKDVQTWEKPNAVGAHWDTGPEHLQWKNVARRLGNEVLRHSPHIVVIVDGISFHTPWDSHENYSWWGSHWKQCKDYNSYFWLDKPNKYIASMHPYGPSVAPTKPQYYEPTYPQNMYEYLDTVGFYLNKEGHCPILVTEWGGKTNDELDNKYQYLLADYMNKLGIWNFHWSFNRLSSDTSSVLILNKDGTYGYDWNRFDICKRACPEPTYLNFKQMTTGYQSQSRSLNLNGNGNGDSRELNGLFDIKVPDENVPAIEFPQEQEKCQFFLPMSFKAQGNRITINQIPVQLAGLTWYGLEKRNTLDLCQNINQFKILLNSLQQLGINYIRFPFSLEPLMNVDLDIGIEDATYFKYIKQIIDECAKYGILTGLSLHNLKQGENPPSLWYSEDYSEVMISDTLQILVEKLRLCPNFFSLELLNIPGEDCKYDSGEFINDFILANERMGNQILSKNPKILLVVNTNNNQITNNVDLYMTNRVVYQTQIQTYQNESFYKNGIIGEYLQEQYQSFVGSNSIAPMFCNLNIDFKSQNNINQCYSYIKWFKQNNIVVIVDDIKNLIKQLQTRMAQDFFEDLTSNFCFKKKTTLQQQGYNDLTYQEQLKERVLQGKVINIPDKIRSIIPSHKDYTNQPRDFQQLNSYIDNVNSSLQQQIDIDIEMEISQFTRNFNKSTHKNYPDEEEINEDIQHMIYKDIIPPQITKENEDQTIESRDIDLSEISQLSQIQDMTNKLDIQNKILHQWIDGKGVPHELHEIIIKNISNKNIQNFELELTPANMIKQIWEVSNYQEDDNILISLNNGFTDNTIFKPNNIYKFGYITQYSTPKLSIKNIYYI